MTADLPKAALEARYDRPKQGALLLMKIGWGKPKKDAGDHHRKDHANQHRDEHGFHGEVRSTLPSTGPSFAGCSSTGSIFPFAGISGSLTGGSFLGSSMVTSFGGNGKAFQRFLTHRETLHGRSRNGRSVGEARVIVCNVSTQPTGTAHQHSVWKVLKAATTRAERR
jgi:hypothetical protein